MEIVRYGLKIAGSNKLLTFTCRPNNGDDCVDVQFTLIEFGDQVWLTDSKRNAEYVAKHSTPWYNASYETPIHCFNAKIEVVEVVLKFK